MTPAPTIVDEAERLSILRSYDVLDTVSEECLDVITRIASRLTDCPIALISLVDEDRQWFKSRVGLAALETPRDFAFCAHAIADPSQALIVPDATRDTRFMDNPLVTEQPGIRFYAGVPLLSAEGHALGTLCVIDHKARDLSDEDLNALCGLAGAVMATLELRRGSRSGRLVAQQHARREERFHKVVEAAPNAMVMVNNAGVMEMVNAESEWLFGYDRTEMVGQPVEMLLPGRFRARHPDLRAGFMADARSRPMGTGLTMYGLRKNGGEFPADIAINPIETDDGTMLLTSIVDLTDRKQREDLVQAALTEKDILLREIHHRVKNNLQIIYSLLDLQSARISDPAVIAMLQDSQNRIQSMALIHQTLYGSNDFVNVDFAQFLRTLIPILTGSYARERERIAVRLDLQRVPLPIDVAVPCGLVMNELITNALRHGFGDEDSGEIQIVLNHRTDNQVVLSVADNGSGLPDDVDIDTTATLGLRLVRLLADQVGGSLVIDRARPTRFTLAFPLKPARRQA